jgi:Coenzyme A transferase
MDETVATAQEAVADIVSDSTGAVGGFCVCSTPSVLLDALLRSDAGDPEVFSNNAGVQAAGVVPAGRLVWGREQRVRPPVSRGGARASFEPFELPEERKRVGPFHDWRHRLSAQSRHCREQAVSMTPRQPRRPSGETGRS